MGWKGTLRAFLPDFLERPLREAAVARRDRRDLARYRSSGVGPPPHALKVATVLEAARRRGIGTLVETGTFEGEMARKCRSAFRAIVTIELSEALAARAAARLKAYRHISVLSGDSARRLPEVLAGLEEPALFWLDGHFSGEGTARGERDTPLRDELRAIGRHPVRGHVVLIDDARLLGSGDYPTLEEIRALLGGMSPDLIVRVEDDIVWCEAAGPSAEGGR